MPENEKETDKAVSNSDVNAECAYTSRLVEMISIRRNPASGVPSAELRFARANSPRCARPVQVFASSPPARKKGMTNVMPFRVLVEMIRLELTTYTLRTYRSTG